MNNLPEWLTPSFVTLVLSAIGLLFILIGFLIGFIRGTYRAGYRFIVSLIVVLGLWLLLPLITDKILSIDLNKFGIDILDIIGYEKIVGGSASSVKDALDIISRITLGLTTESGKTLILSQTSVVITETYIYITMLSAIEMVLRCVLLLVILILNFTLFRFIFFIVYLFIKPRRENRYSVKKPMKSRLIGAAIGTVNMIIILLLVCVPLSGVFSLAEDAVSLIEMEDKEDAVIMLSLGSEVVTLDNNPSFVDQISEYTDYAKVYRNSLLGKLFSVKFGGTEFDCILFDNLFKLNIGNEEIKIRKEIHICITAIKPIKDSVIMPILNNEDIAVILDNLSSEDIKKVFDELAELKIVNACVNLGLNTGQIICENNEDLLNEYVGLREIILKIKDKEVDLTSLIKGVGTLAETLIKFTEQSNIKISSLLNNDGDTLNVLFEGLLNTDTALVTNMFNAIADIELIDLLQEVSFTTLQDYLDNNDELSKFILLYPKVEVKDNLIYLNDNKTNITAENVDINNIVFKLSANKTWIVNDIETTVNAEDSIFKINIENIKITDEIRNFGSLYAAFKDLGIKSISEIQVLIENGPTALGSYKLENLTYEKIDNLFKALLDFKIISNSTNNLYCILNNMLPNEYRGLMKMSKLDSEDLSSLVYAAKLVCETGIVWDFDSLYEGEQINSEKLYEVFTQVKDGLAENLVKSNLICDNIALVANYAVNLFVPDLKVDFDCIDWANDGEKELKNLFNAISPVVKYLSKITTDFNSLTDEELDEITTALKENIKDSKLIKSNMNAIITKVSSLDVIKEYGITIAPLAEEEWTEEEIASIFDSLKIVMNLMKDSEEELIAKIAKLSESDIDTLLNSKFLSTTIVYNLCELTKEGKPLYEILIINLDANSSDWYDSKDKKGELRIILENALNFLDGIDSLEDEDLYKKIINKLASLNSNYKGDNDEVGYLLSSNIISDTLIYHIENIDKYLGENITKYLVIKDDINWKDTETDKGELRKIIEAIDEALIDDEGNILLDDFLSEDINKPLQVVINLSDEKLLRIFNSSIILNSMSKAIEDFNDIFEMEIKLFVQEKDRTEEDWKNEIVKIVNALQELLVDKEGNLVDINTISENYINIIIDREKESVERIFASEIVVDTIAHLIINMEDEYDNIFYVQDKYKTTDEDWNNTYTSMWKEELITIFESSKEALVDEEGNLLLDKLTGEDTTEMLKVISQISSDKISKLTESTILVDSIAHIIIDLASDDDSVFYVQSLLKSDEWSDVYTALWKEEIKSIISSCKVLLFDDDDNFLGDKLINGTTNEQIKLLVDVSDEDIDVLTESTILVDSIAHIIIDLANEDDSVFVVREKFISEGLWDNTYTTIWKNEIESILKGIKILLVDEEGNVILDKLESGETKEIINIIMDINNSELDDLVLSEIIVDTISNIIVKMADEENSIIVVSSKVRAYETENWREEVKKLIKSIKELLISSDGEKQTDKLLSGNENDIISLLIDIENQDKVNRIIDSEIIYDTIVKVIKDLGEGEDKVLYLPNNINSYSKNDWSNEIFNIINASKIILVTTDSEGKQVVDFDKLNGDTETLLLTISDIEDSEVDTVLSSEIIYETFINYINKLDTNDSAIAIPDTSSWSKQVWKEELKDIIASINILLVEESSEGKKVNLDKLNGTSNELIQLIVDLYDESQEEDDLSVVLRSQIIVYTISKQIIAIESEDIKTDSVKDYTIVEWRKEIRSLVFSTKEILSDEDGKVNLDEVTSDTNKVLKKLKSLENNSASANDEVGKILESKIITDTIINVLKQNSTTQGGMLVIPDDIIYVDVKDGITTQEGEIRLIIRAISILFKGDVDIDNIDANIVLDLTDDEVDTVLESQIFSSTIETKLKEMNSDDIIVSEITDLPKEVKAIVKASKIILASESGDVDLANPTFDVEKIMHLTDEEQEVILSSQIIFDTIKHQLIKMNKDTIVYTNEIKITDWKQEILSLLQTLNKDTFTNSTNGNRILKADTNGKYLTNPEVDYEVIYNLTEDEIVSILNSNILLDTITLVLKDNTYLSTDNYINEITKDYANFDKLSVDKQNEIITSYTGWKDEIKLLLKAATYITDGEEVNIDKLTSLEENKLNEVFSSQVLLDTFYSEIIKLTEDANPVLVIKDGTDLNKAEAVKFVQSIQVVLNGNITDVSSTDFNFDKFTSLKDSEIEKLLGSSIIKYSAAKKAYEVLGEGALKDYIMLKEDEESSVDYISNDLNNLLKVIRDLDQKHNISYESFSFDSFMEPINSAKDKDAKADAISDTLLQSVIIQNSISKMINKILNDVMDQDMIDCINTDLDKTATGGKNLWLDDPETNEIGEFKKVFRMLAYVDQFTNVNSLNNSNTKDKDSLITPLKGINSSLCLRGVLPLFVNKATANVDSWKYNEKDSLYKDPNNFTKEEWDIEIETICEIISLVNNDETIANLSSIDVKDEAFSLSSLETLLKEIAKSRILNIACIEDLVQEGVNDTFFSGEEKAKVNKLYSGSDYNEKVSAWNDPATGEIGKLISALELLRKIEGTDINKTEQGLKNASAIGSFLDACKESKLLSSVIVTIVNEKYATLFKALGMTITEDSINTIEFATTLPMVAKLV